MLDMMRTKIFKGLHQVKYNKLWFKMIFTALLQNTADDFAFKTTFTHLGVKRPLLTNKAKYQEYNIEVVEDFVNSIKPFHTKLLSSMESNTHGESTNIEIEDITRNNVITFNYADHSTRTWAGDSVLMGGGLRIDDTNGNVDYSLFTHVQADLTDDYNGQVFVQPATEGWGEELVPTDFTENINMLVQTNASGSTVTNDSRAFRIVQFQPMDIQESHAIVDLKKAELLANATVFDDEITVHDITALDDPNNLGANNLVPGVAWIGTERIEYLAIDATGPGTAGKLIGVTRGTLGTSPKAHSIADEIWNAGPSTRIPTLKKFSHYGDGLRLAYNDYSTSLASAGTTPEHAFIRSVGKGTI